MSVTSENKPKTNLLGLDQEGLKQFCDSLGEKPFRAVQLERWIHRRGAKTFDEMTDLAKSFRAKLSQIAEIKGPEILRDKISADETRKWLVDVGNQSRHLVHFYAGRMCNELFVLFNRQTRFQPKPDDCRDYRSALACRTYPQTVSRHQ